MSQMSDRARSPVGLLEPELAPGHVRPDTLESLGGLSIAGAESAHLPEPDSLLELYRFSSEYVERTRRIIAEADANPKIRQANYMLHDLVGMGGEYADFAKGVFIHQRDVAELAVATALEVGIEDEEMLMALALAGLSHDAAKGKVDDDPQENLAAVFMHRGRWDEAMRRTGEKHPEIGAQVQREVGLSELTQYLTERHHKDLKENPERHIKAGGYGGETITPPAGMELLWAELAHIFSASDDVAALTRQRGYKDGMLPAQAVQRMTENLATPKYIVDIYREVAGMQVVA